MRGSHSFKGATRSERVAGPVTVIDRNERRLSRPPRVSLDAADIPFVDRVAMAVLVDPEPEAGRAHRKGHQSIAAEWDDAA